jgi:broad specificity phosphatase PhoE
VILKLVRHGESRANTGELNPQAVGDQRIPLTERGHQQVREVGEQIGASFLRKSLIYRSPYRRTRETLGALLEGAGVEQGELRIREDPRLREVEHGYGDVEAQTEKREIHGWFYYRFEGGESPADCFDRTSQFLESLMREAERKGTEQALVVTHGLTIRCFVMRFLHLSVEEFESIANPRNCAIVTLAPKASLTAPLFTTSFWGVEGLEPRA